MCKISTKDCAKVHWDRCWDCILMWGVVYGGDKSPCQWRSRPLLVRPAADRKTLFLWHEVLVPMDRTLLSGGVAKNFCARGWEGSAQSVLLEWQIAACHLLSRENDALQFVFVPWKWQQYTRWWGKWWGWTQWWRSEKCTITVFGSCCRKHIPPEVMMVPRKDFSVSTGESYRVMGAGGAGSFWVFSRRRRLFSEKKL